MCRLPDIRTKKLKHISKKKKSSRNNNLIARVPNPARAES